MEKNNKAVNNLKIKLSDYFKSFICLIKFMSCK